jgi:hypothetical protein
VKGGDRAPGIEVQIRHHYTILGYDVAEITIDSSVADFEAEQVSGLTARQDGEQTQKRPFRHEIGRFCVCSRGIISPCVP